MEEKIPSKAEMIVGCGCIVAILIANLLWLPTIIGFVLIIFKKVFGL